MKKLSGVWNQTDCALTSNAELSLLAFYKVKERWVLYCEVQNIMKKQYKEERIGYILQFAQLCFSGFF